MTENDPFAAAQVSSTGTATATAVDDPFGVKPSDIRSDFPKVEDFNGQLLVIQPTKFERDLPNNLGKAGDTQDRITADVTAIDLDDPKSSKTTVDLYISQGALVGQLKGLVPTRGMLLGVLRRHRAKNTPEGFNTPDEIEQMLKDWVANGARGNKPFFAWKMSDPTDEQKAKAIEWYRSKS